MRVVRLQHGIFSSLLTSLAGFTKSSLGEYKVLGMMGLVRQNQKRRFLRHVRANLSRSQTYKRPGNETTGRLWSG